MNVNEFLIILIDDIDDWNQMCGNFDHHKNSFFCVSILFIIWSSDRIRFESHCVCAMKCKTHSEYVLMESIHKSIISFYVRFHSIMYMHSLLWYVRLNIAYCSSTLWNWASRNIWKIDEQKSTFSERYTYKLCYSRKMTMIYFDLNRSPIEYTWIPSIKFLIHTWHKNLFFSFLNNLFQKNSGYISFCWVIYISLFMLHLL